MKKDWISLLLVAVFLAGCAPKTAKIEIVNRSEDPVKIGMIRVCDRKLVVDGLKAAETRSFSFDLCEDNTYHIDLLFKSDKTLKKQMSSESSDHKGVKDVIIINPTDLEIRTVNM